MRHQKRPVSDSSDPIALSLHDSAAGRVMKRVRIGLTMVNLESVEKIANALLYEGYLLYPYRRSAVKNQHRFNFGVLYPPRFCQEPDPFEMRIECLAEGSAPSIEVRVRFLQLRNRGDWQEGLEREVGAASALHHSMRVPFGFEDVIEGEIGLSSEPLADGLQKITLRVK